MGDIEHLENIIFKWIKGDLEPKIFKDTNIEIKELISTQEGHYVQTLSSWIHGSKMMSIMISIFDIFRPFQNASTQSSSRQRESKLRTSSQKEHGGEVDSAEMSSTEHDEENPK